MPKINTAYDFDIALVSQADTRNFQANPTLAAGDFKVSKDEGAFTNLTNLPVVTPAGGRNIKVSLTATEMNANRVTLQAVDAAGAEWCDLLYIIETSPDDLTIAGISDGVWDEDRSGHLTANTYGQGVASVQGNITGSVASVTAGVSVSNAGVDAILDRTDAVETGLTPRQTLRLLAAIMGGKISGADTSTTVFRNALADSKNRVTATTDSSGNRITITVDLS